MLEKKVCKKASGDRSPNDDSRQVILEAAIEEFSTLRSSGTSLERIAKLAGVKPQMLSSYYKSVDALWLEVVTKLFDEAAEAMKKGLADAGMETPEAPVRGLVNGLVDFASRRPQHFRILLLEEKEDNERLQWIIQQSTGSIYTISKLMIERAQEEKAMRMGDPSRIFYATIGLVVSQFIWSAQYKQLTERDPFSPDEIEHVKQLAHDFLGLET